MNMETMGVGLLPCTYAVYVLILRLKGKNKNFRSLFQNSRYSMAFLTKLKLIHNNINEV